MDQTVDGIADIFTVMKDIEQPVQTHIDFKNRNRCDTDKDAAGVDHLQSPDEDRLRKRLTGVGLI